MSYTNLLGYPLEQVIKILDNKGVTIEQIIYTRPTKTNEEYKNKRVVRIKETKEHGVLLVVAMFLDFNIKADNP